MKKVLVCIHQCTHFPMGYRLLGTAVELVLTLYTLFRDIPPPPLYLLCALSSALPVKSIRTTSPWTSAFHSFTVTQTSTDPSPSATEFGASNNTITSSTQTQNKNMQQSMSNLYCTLCLLYTYPESSLKMLAIKSRCVHMYSCVHLDMQHQQHTHCNCKISIVKFCEMVKVFVIGMIIQIIFWHPSNVRAHNQ